MFYNYNRDILWLLYSAHRDISLERFLVGEVLMIPGDVSMSFTYRVDVGSRAPDLGAGLFLSKVFLSHDDVLDMENDLAIVSIPSDTGNSFHGPVHND